MKCLLLTMTLAVCLVTNGSAQAYLSLQKPMSYRNIRYYKGDVIGVLLQGVKGRVTYSLIDFNDSCLTLETGERIPFSRIRAIVRGPERGSIVAQYAKVGFVAAGLYLVLDLANSDFVPAPSTFWVSGAIAASAAACLPFKYRRHRTARGWRLYYVQPEPASQQGSTP